MVEIRPKDLPAGTPLSTASLIFDSGLAVEKSTPIGLVDAATPLASQAEAEAGSNNEKRVTPLRVAQAVSAQIKVPLAQNSGATLVNTIASGVGASVRTVQNKLREMVSPEDFGAVADGGTDCTAALQAAVNSLPFGGRVTLGRGSYKYTALMIPDGVTLVGSNDYGTSLICSSGTGKIELGVSSGIESLKITASVTRLLGSEFVFINNSNGSVRSCVFANYSLAIKVGTIPGVLVVKPVIDSCNFFNPVIGAGSGAIELNYYSNAIVTNCVGAGAALPGQQPDFGIRLRNGDTAYLVNNNFTLHGKGLLIDPPASYNAYATNISNCTFDSAGLISGGNYASSAEIIPAGGVFDTLISNCWFGLSSNRSGCFVEPQGAGVVDGIAFTGCEFPDNGDCGLIVDGVGAINWSVTGGWSSANTNAGLRAAGATKRFTITGHRAGNVATRGPNNIGVQVDNATAADYYLICNNNLVGNTTTGLFDGGTGVNKQVSANLT